MKKYTLPLYLLIVGAAVAFFIIKKEVIFLQLRHVSPVNLVFLALAVFMHQFLNGMRFRYLLQVFGLSMPFREWFGLTVCNTMFSYYLPARGGLAVRAIYLKHRYQFSYARHASLLAGASLICLAISAAAGAVFLGALSLVGGEWFPTFFFLFLFLLAAILAAAAVISFLCSRNYRTRYARLNNILENFTGGFGYFRSNRNAVFKFGAYHVLSIFLLAVRLYFSFAALGVKIAPLKLLVIQSLTGFSMVLSITPGNLGIKEGIITFSAGLLQLSPDTAMLAAMLDRAAAMAVVFSLGLIFSHLLLRDLPKGLNEVQSAAGREG